MRTIAVSVCALAATLALAAPASAKPRFKVTGFTPPAELTPGGPLPADVAVRNSGKPRKRARLRVLLRSADGSEIEVLRMRTARIARTASVRILPFVPVIAPGEYELAACVPKRGNRGPLRCLSRSAVVTDSVAPTTPPASPNFTPGARSLNDPLLPQIGNGGYDARHYEIDLDYDPTANNFDSASLTMRAVATQDLSQLSLDFQDLPVDGVLVDGVAAQFSQVDATPALAGGGTQPMKLVIDPASGIASGAGFTVVVEYHGQPQVFTDPDGSDEGWIPSVVPTSSYFVVGEPLGSQAWFPSNNHPSDKASFETLITVPTGRTAIGVGELVAQAANGDGTTTWHWQEDSPTATYLVTASNAAGAQYSESSIIEGSTGRTLPVYDTIAPSALPGRPDLTSRNKEMLDALGLHYGPYPLDSYGSFWDQNPAVGYALEVQTKSHFSSTAIGAGTYVHELAHQWWGNAVTLHDWNDLWFNEGWAQFSDWLFEDPNAPKDNFDDQYANAPAGDWTIAPAVLDNDPAKMFSPSFPTYTRGAMTLVGFREIIGHAAFDQFARGLQAEFRHGNIDTPQFIAFAKEFSGFSGAELERLDAYFQQWLYGTTRPTLTYADF